MIDQCFIHVSKTGGTSIESALGWRRYGAKYHLPALAHKTQMGHKKWAKIFSWAFVRHPLDRIVSQYNWFVFDGSFGLHTPSFEAWVMQGCPMMRSQWLMLSQGGRVIVKFVGRFENLQVDFNEVMKRVGGEHIELPHSRALPHDPYMTYYESPAIEEQVRRTFAKDFKAFNYA